MSEQLNQAQLTAPETIYLQHNDSGYMDEPFPADHSGTSRCDEEVFNCDVRYVRADIAEGKQAEQQARIAELEARINILLEQRNRLGQDVQNAAITGVVPENHAIGAQLGLVANMRAKVAALEAQAAIGRRAVEVVDQALPVWDGDGIDPERHHCELTLLNERHRARAEIFSRLRDAEQASGQGILDSSAPELGNSRVILDSSGHVPGAAKMVTDRQLADAVNELRAITIAADALVDRWHTPLWKDAKPTAEYIAALRLAAESARKLLAGGE